MTDIIKIIKGKDFQLPQRHGNQSSPEVRNAVSEIIEQVRTKRDLALREYTLKFDKVKLNEIRVPSFEIERTLDNLQIKDRDVLEKAIANVRRFHEKQGLWTWKESFSDNTELGQIVTPLDRVGIYIPGGRAVYPSTLIMNAVPAQLAQVPSIAVVSPPQPNGYPHEMVLATCAILGLTEVYAVGGAQSIAALAYGTETIESVCKITGPGNEYVAEAKRQVFGKVGIDSIAGPSEILILHDDQEIPVEYVVRDMLSQTEHDPEAQAILITTSEDYANQVKARLNELVPTLPRKEIIQSSLSRKGMIVHIENINQGVDIVNQTAPEHFELLVKDTSIVEKIRNAGAIFVGKWSSEPVGDYLAGPNHTIPTSGAAKYASPLQVSDFQKHSSFISYSKERFQKEGQMIMHLAEMEQLFAHAQAIKVRMD